MGGEKPGVQGVNAPVGSARVAEVIHRVGVNCRVYRDGDVGGHGWRCAAGIAHSSDDEPPVSCVTVTKKIPFGRGGIEVITPSWTVWTIPRGNKIPECCQKNRPAVENRAL